MNHSFQTSISKEEINLLPTLDFKGELWLIENLADAQEAARELQSATILGFDTETRPSFTKGEFYHVALLQLATEKCTYLFRLNKIKLPPEVVSILTDPKIIKVGVAIHDDLKGLQKLTPFEPQGFIDLAKEAQKRGVQTFGLRALTAIYLGKRLSKAAKITNWERSVLTEPQLLYAANDALAGLSIYKVMFNSVG
jgi:ribonuclease D